LGLLVVKLLLRIRAFFANRQINRSPVDRFWREALTPILLMKGTFPPKLIETNEGVPKFKSRSRDPAPDTI